jgi:hypothetical protein
MIVSPESPRGKWGLHVALRSGSDMKGKTRTLIQSEAALYLEEEGYLKEDRQVVFHGQAREASAPKRPVSAPIKARMGRQRSTAFIFSFREHPVVAGMERLMLDAISSWKGSFGCRRGV